MQQPAPLTNRPLDLAGMLLLTFCCMTWGVNQVAFKIANEGISPIFQAALRSAIVSAMLIAWAWSRGVPLFQRDGTLPAGIAVGLGFTGNFIFIGPGLALTEASRGVLFYYTAPFFVAIGAHFLIPGDRLNVAKSIGLVCAFCGLVVSVGDRLGGARSASLLGDFYCLVAGMFWACSTLSVRTTELARSSSEKILLYQLAVSAPLLLAAAWFYDEPGIIDLNGRVLIAFAFTVVVVVFASFLIWFYLLRHYQTSQISTFSFTTPIFAVLAGHLILGEPVTWRVGAALALVALGIALVNRPRAS